MPSVNLRKPIYDELVRQDEDPVETMNRVMTNYLKEEHGIEVDA